MGETWGKPEVQLDGPLTEHSIGWAAVAISSLIVIGGGFLYCDLRYGKTFGVSAHWDGWRPMHVSAGCR